MVYQRTTTTGHAIIGAFVSPSGVVQPGSPFAIDNSTNDNQAPVVAFDGTNYLVVYQRTVSSTNHDIIGALVSKSGTVQPGSPFAIDNSTNDDLAPAVAFNGTNYLVVYQRLPTSGTNHDIMGAFVSTSGTGVGGGPITPFAIDNSTNDDLSPAVASDGRDYLVVCEEVFTSVDHDIIGVRVDSTGGALGCFFWN